MSNGSFQNAFKTVTGKATRAMNNLLQFTIPKQIPLKIMINLTPSLHRFYTILVRSVTNELTERLHRKFL